MTHDRHANSIIGAKAHTIGNGVLMSLISHMAFSFVCPSSDKFLKLSIGVLTIAVLV